MDREQILSKITENLADIIDREDLVLTEESTADEVDDWDSLNHVKLMVAIEGEFGIRFESDEISAPETIGELIDMIQSKLDA